MQNKDSTFNTYSFVTYPNNILVNFEYLLPLLEVTYDCLRYILPIYNMGSEDNRAYVYAR